MIRAELIGGKNDGLQKFVDDSASEIRIAIFPPLDITAATIGEIPPDIIIPRQDVYLRWKNKQSIVLFVMQPLCKYYAK